MHLSCAVGQLLHRVCYHPLHLHACLPYPGTPPLPPPHRPPTTPLPSPTVRPDAPQVGAPSALPVFVSNDTLLAIANRVLHESHEAAGRAATLRARVLVRTRNWHQRHRAAVCIQLVSRVTTPIITPTSLHTKLIRAVRSMPCASAAIMLNGQPPVVSMCVLSTP